MNVSIAIKTLREKKGQNQKTYAESLQISQTYLSQIESGKKKPSMEMLEKISSNSDISLPLLLMLSVEDCDIAESKLDAFKMIEKSLKALLTSFV